jgi:hypothetical protein
MSESVKIENVTIAYPHLWVKHAPPGTDQEKYGAEFILDPTTNAKSIAALDAAFRKVATDAGKGALVDMLKNPCQEGDKLNLLSGSKGKNPRPEIVGKRVLRASDSNYAPAVVDQRVQPIPVEQSGNVFGGCIVHAYIDLYWSNNATNPGVYAGLRGVQLVTNVGVGHIGGGALSAESMFAPVISDSPSWE